MKRNKSRSKILKVEKRLQIFLERSKELSELEYLKDGITCEILIVGDTKSKTSTEKTDEEHIRSFMLLFRHFISDSEPVFINRIFNDTCRYLTDSALIEKVKEAKDQWKHDMDLGPFGMSMDGEDLTPEHAIDIWINGHYFHSDFEKHEDLIKFGQQPAGLAYLQLRLSLPRLVSHILFMKDIIQNAFDNELFNFD